VLIDPGDQPKKILEEVERQGNQIAAILLTHGHFDHVGAVRKIASEVDCPVYLHPDDRSLPPALSAGLFWTELYRACETLTFGDLCFTVLHTPGHTPGSVCLRCGDVLFSGDTLFAGGCGRTDFPGGDAEQMAASLRRLGSIPEDLRVLPGHGESSTLNAERRTNYFMLQALYPEEFR
jgi:glyoxylase-like metal-dependent hydrolase (beta-lactamase superfamily II)